MIFRNLVATAVFLVASAAQAGRVALSDMGLSVLVPTGWNLEYLPPVNGDTARSPRMYWMYNTANVERANFYFEAWNGVNDLGARSWVTEEGWVRSLNIQGQLYNELYLDDSVKQDGLFAWRVYGRYAQLGADSLPDKWIDEYSRSTAYGDIGWVVSFEGDTSDVDTAGPTYTKILDSVKIDRSFQTLPKVGLKFPASSRSRQTLRATGQAVEIFGVASPTVRAADILGRRVDGDLERTIDGWLWKPRALRPGIVQLRVLGSGRDESLRAVFRP